MRRVLQECTIRPLRPADAPSLAVHGDNRRVWRNLRDRFPHPYEERHAEKFIAVHSGEEPPRVLGIIVDGEAAGTVGFTPGSDVERCSAEVGYWLGEPFWGRGILTAVLRTVSPWAIEAFELNRIFALPFADNAASCRVLEKAGYVLEGKLRRSAVKDGEIKNQRLYAYYGG